MEQSNTTTTAPDPPVTNELVRPLEGRMIAGVAQGFANRYDLPVWVPRVFFVICAFFGGLGVALYAVGWALIRSEDEAESPAQRFFSGASTSRSWIGIGLVFLAVLILLDNFTFLSGGVVWAVGLLVIGVLLYTGDLPGLISRNQTKEADQQVTSTETQPRATVPEHPATGGPTGGGTPPTPTPTPPMLPPKERKPKEPSYLGRVTIGAMLLGLGVLALLDAIPGVPVFPEARHYMALAVTILGVGLLVGAIWGRARWLIIVAAVLVPTLLFSPVFEWDWTSDSFDQQVQPAQFVDLEDTYAIDIGNLVIDLRDLPWNGQDIDLTASVDVGNLEVIIPSDVAITGSASVDIGRVGAPGRESSGLGNPNLVFDTRGAGGSVDLDLHVDMGNIDIRVRG
jgi:phage shock protein PspC (stress-responsive transcriptional regulator)